VLAGAAFLLACAAAAAFVLKPWVAAANPPTAPSSVLALTPIASWPSPETCNGTNYWFTLPDSALDTGAGESFTVSVWVYLTSTGGWATAVSEDGTVNSAFYLQYSWQDNRWAFSRALSDTVGADAIRALSKTPPVTGRWTHLVGVYSSSAQQLSLYVNGVLAGTKPYSTPFDGQGDVVVARAESDSEDTDWFPGQISDIQVFQQALTASQVSALS
jgi:Concanavalin A-like lectin/glucanases superfamily